MEDISNIIEMLSEDVDDHVMNMLVDYELVMGMFEEEEKLLVALGRERPKNENYWETVDKYNDTEFREHFRINRLLAEDIARRFSASTFYTEQTGGNGKVSPLQHVLIFLWFAGHQTASFRDVADRFNITISTLFRINVRLIYFLSGMSADVIRWPDQQECQQIEAAFRERGFPHVIGVVDGSHVRIDKPVEDPDSYYNRKKHFSIQMQVCCDDRLKIRSTLIGFPSSVHDARVFACSDLGTNLRRLCGDYTILGDSAYPCLRNLNPPFKDTGNLTRARKNFNQTLSKCQISIEHCFGLLKQKFRQLYHCKVRHTRNILHFIRACCVLHNLAIDDEIPDPVADHPTPEAEDVPGDPEETEPDAPDGVAFRNYLLTELSS